MYPIGITTSRVSSHFRESQHLLWPKSQPAGKGWGSGLPWTHLGAIPHHGAHLALPYYYRETQVKQHILRKLASSLIDNKGSLRVFYQKSTPVSLDLGLKINGTRNLKAQTKNETCIDSFSGLKTIFQNWKCCFL